jgi:hypothetical protein
MGRTTPGCHGVAVYDPVMAESTVSGSDPGPRVTIKQVASETYHSGSALARAFGGPILEPTWWPPDTEEISYSLAGEPDHAHYDVGSVRAGGVPICVIGFWESAWNGRSPRDWLDGEWSEPSELAHLRGLIGKVGVPPSLQVVLYDQQLAIQLIGYGTEAEIMSAVMSLRTVEPEE